MSLKTESYGLSYLIFQVIFALIGGIIITVPTVGNEVFWGVDSSAAVSKGLALMISTVLYNMAQVPFTMCLSTMFKEPKIGNSFGGMFVWAVILIPLQLL